MKIAVFSDVHGNLPALELMLKDAGKVDGYICLGDTVDYGPWSNECVDLITDLPKLVFLEGNHEHDFLKGSYSGTNPVASAFFNFCLPRFDRFEKIKNLPVKYRFEGMTFQHTILNKNIYPDSVFTLDDNYVIGHSHHQFKIENNGFSLINPGSVGQDRKYINMINYTIYDTHKHAFEMRSLTYDVDKVILRMRQDGYPDKCIKYYVDKERC